MNIFCFNDSPSGVQLSRGRKRPYSSSALVVGELRSKSDVIEALQKHSSASVGSSDAPLCRPWDRGDLLKRLATFKSMTWFGKPKVCFRCFTFFFNILSIFLVISIFNYVAFVLIQLVRGYFTGYIVLVFLGNIYY